MHRFRKTKCLKDRKQHRNIREKSQLWKKVTSEILLPHVEDTHALNMFLKSPEKGTKQEHLLMILFGVEMMEAKELFPRVS